VTAGAAEPTSDVLPHRLVWGLSLANGIVWLNVPLLIVALPSLRGEFHVSLAELVWVSGVTIGLAITPFLVPGGRLADTFGDGPTLLTGLFGMAVASLICFLAPSLGVLIGARVLQGIAGALVVSTAYAAVGRHVRHKSQGFAAGAIDTVGTAFQIVAPLLGGVLALYTSWRFAFVVSAILCSVAAAMLAGQFRKIEVGRPKQAQLGSLLDIPGSAALAVAIVFVSLFLAQGPTWGYSSPLLISSLVVSISAGVVFIWLETRAEHPIVDFALFKNLLFAGSIVQEAALNFILSAAMFFLALYTVSVLGQSQVVAGAIFLVYLVPSTIGGLLAGWSFDKRGPRVLHITAAAVMAAGTALLLLISGSTGTWVLIPHFIVFGLAVSAVPAVANSGVIKSVSLEEQGIASGMAGIAMLLSSSLGIAVCSPIFHGVARSSLDKGLASLDLSAGHVREVEGVLGTISDASSALDGLDSPTRAAIDSAANAAIIDGLMVVFYLLTGVAMVAVITAVLTAKSRYLHSRYSAAPGTG